MMNFIALNTVGYLVRGPLQEPTRIYPQSSSIPAGTHLPMLVPGTRLHMGFALAIVAALVSWYVVRNTAAGFRLRVVGANAHAAASAGRPAPGAEDIAALPDQRRALYLTRRTDVTMYLVGASDAEIKQEPGLARSNVQRIISDQCSSQSLDGTRLGWRRALPSFESRATAARALRPFAPM